MAVDRTDGVGRGNIYLAQYPALFSSSANSGLLFETLYFNIPSPVPLTLSVGFDGAVYIVDPGSWVVVSRNAQNAGVTWSKNIPISPMFDSWIGYPSGQCKLGEYYHMVSDNLGANLAYAATFNGEQDVYFLRIGPWDCNGNEIDDAADIAESRSRDCNGNDVPDECEYRVDLDGDGLTTPTDFAALRVALTGPGGTLSGSCTELLDPDHDGDADLHDLYLLHEVFVRP